jgi:hypothetical protein
LTHPAFISRSAALDHIHPIAGGGDPTALDNLVTACWNCNRRKGDLELDELGWTLVEPRDKEWKGLTELFRPLWEAAGHPSLGEDESALMRAVMITRAESNASDIRQDAPICHERLRWQVRINHRAAHHAPFRIQTGV